MLKAVAPRFNFGHVEQAGQLRVAACAPPVECPAEQAVHRIGPAKKLLQVVGGRANQIRFEVPAAFRGEAPVVEREPHLELRRGAAMARARVLQAKLIRRIGQVAFYLVPIEPVVARLPSFHVAGERRTFQWSQHAALPVGATGDAYGLGVHAAEAIDEIVPRFKVPRVQRHFERRITGAEGAAHLQVTGRRGDLTWLDLHCAAIHQVVIPDPRRRGDLVATRGEHRSPEREPARFKLLEVSVPRGDRVHIHRSVPVQCGDREVAVVEGCENGRQAHPAGVGFSAELQAIENQAHFSLHDAPESAPLEVRDFQLAAIRLVAAAAADVRSVEPRIRQLYLPRGVAPADADLFVRVATLAGETHYAARRIGFAQDPADVTEVKAAPVAETPARLGKARERGLHVELALREFPPQLVHFQGVAPEGEPEADV